jgi:hypothetical protein
MMNHFAACKLKSFVLTQVPPENDPNEDNYDSDIWEEWDAQDAKARGAIMGACTAAMRTHIEKVDTSKAMWTILARHANSADSEKGRAVLVHQFQAIRAVTGEPLSNYIGKLTEIRDSLKATTHEIPEHMFREQLLNHLPEIYNTTKQIIENKDVRPTNQEIIDILMRRELDLVRSVTSGNSSATSESALYSSTPHYRGSYAPRYRGNRRGGGRGYNSDFRSFPYTHPSELTCYSCGKKGHRARECPQRFSGCFSCGDPLHASRDCPHTSLTPEQARKGRTAHLNWFRNRPANPGASANLGQDIQGPEDSMNLR